MNVAAAEQRGRHERVVRVQHAPDERGDADDGDHDAAPTTAGSVQPAWPGLGERPRRRAEADDREAGADEVEPRAACGSRVSGTARVQHTMTSAATGTLMRNAHRQPGPSTSQPPTNGPIAPATPPSPDHAPTAAARSSLRKLACRIARLPGVSSAAPTPCSTRADDEHLDVRRRAAQQRRGREPHGADHEDPAPAEAVAERAAEQDQRREREQVAGQHPLQTR